MTDICKVEEVARGLGIEMPEVWLMAGRGEITPCLQITGELMYSLTGSRTKALVTVSGLFTLAEASITDWLSRGTDTFDAEIFFPVRIDYIKDESEFGDLAVDAETLEEARFPWDFDIDVEPDKFQLAVSLGEPATRVIHLEDFVYLRKQVEALVSRTSSNTATSIREMVKPKAKDDWFFVIEDAVKDFEKRAGFTPSGKQLWNTLAETPPEEWKVDYDEKGNQLTMPTGKSMDREAFGKRYKRYYPGK